MTNVGLVLTGGGARGAYQVGAILALSEILGNSTPFRMLAGVSAGAINTVALGIDADNFPRGARRLAEIWSSLTTERVYRTDASNLSKLGMRWLKDLTLGGALGPSKSNYLLDTAPLRDLLLAQLDTSRLPVHIASGVLRGIAVSATNYLTGTSVTVYVGAPEI